MKQLGKYEILEKIGEGGFGVVYKGRDPVLDRMVAVKTCTSDAKKIRKRFFREAEISGRLRHPNIVTVHDFGVESGTPYLVQEFLPGRDLHHTIEEYPDLPIGTRVRFLRGVAEGLRYAHSKGVIHRDVKPANVRVIDKKRVKVMDFGIAKIKGEHDKLTDTGLPMGTVAYLSPEQLSDTGIDHRCDIFAFGVLSYEVLCDMRPFRATSVHALFYQLLNEEAEPIRSHAPDAPAELEELVARCLQKDRTRRFGSFDQLIDQLEALQQKIPGAWQRTEQSILLSRLSNRVRDVEELGARARRALASGDVFEAETEEFSKPGTPDPPAPSAKEGPTEAEEHPTKETPLPSKLHTSGSDEIPLEFSQAAKDVLEHLDCGEMERAALAFVELEQKARGATFLNDIRLQLDAAFKARRTAS